MKTDPRPDTCRWPLVYKYGLISSSLFCLATSLSNMSSSKPFRKGSYEFPFSREELKGFGIALEFEESPMTTGVPCNTGLLNWYRSRKHDLVKFLALNELQATVPHNCSARRPAMECHYRSPGGHILLSRTCSSSPDYVPGMSASDFGEPTISVAGLLRSDSWTKQMYLDALSHDFGDLDLRRPLSPYIMDDVLRGSATREDLWVLEGVVFRQLHTSESLFLREAFALMWAAVYRAKTGFQAPFMYFQLMRLALDAGSENDKRMIKSARLLNENMAWVEFFRQCYFVRGRWRNAADIIKGVPCATHLFPKGCAEGEGGVGGPRPDLFGKRPSMPKRHAASREGFGVSSSHEHHFAECT